MILLKQVRRAGEYSRGVIIPKAWFIQVGEPRRVKILVGRKRLIIYPAEDNGNPKEGTHGETSG